MQDGQIALDGAPGDVLTDSERLRPFRLDAPPMASLAERLRAQGMPIAQGVLQVEDLAREVERLCR